MKNLLNIQQLSCLGFCMNRLVKPCYLAAILIPLTLACSEFSGSDTKGLFSKNAKISVACTDGANGIGFEIEKGGRTYATAKNSIGRGVYGEVFPIKAIDGKNDVTSKSKVLKVYRGGSPESTELSGKNEQTIYQLFERFTVKTEYLGYAEAGEDIYWGFLLKDRVYGDTLDAFYRDFNSSLSFKEAKLVYEKFKIFKKNLAKKMLEIYQKENIFLDDLHAQNIMWDQKKEKFFIVDGFIRKSREDLKLGFRHENWNGPINEQWFIDYLDTYRDLGSFENKFLSLVENSEVNSSFGAL